MLLDVPMAKRKVGRPPKGADEPEDKQVRVFKDLAEMISWIQFCRKKEGHKESVAQILDPLLRKQVVQMFAPYAETVKSLQAKKKAHPPLPDSGPKPAG